MFVIAKRELLLVIRYNLVATLHSFGNFTKNSFSCIYFYTSHVANVVYDKLRCLSCNNCEYALIENPRILSNTQDLDKFEELLKFCPYKTLEPHIEKANCENEVGLIFRVLVVSVSANLLKEKNKKRRWVDCVKEDHVKEVKTGNDS